MGQTNAILRSFGIRYGYYDPKSWKQAIIIDSVLESYGDVLTGMSSIIFSPEDGKEAAGLAFQSGALTKYHNFLEKILTQSKGKFVAGKKVTIADFILASHIHNMVMNDLSPVKHLMETTLVNCPKLQAYIKVNMAEFKEWNTKRQPGPM